MSGECGLIARKREVDNSIQTLDMHSENVSRLCMEYGKAIGASEILRIIGSFHDIGKSSKEFQNYITNGGKRGSVDHASAGGQILYSSFCSENLLLAQLMALPVFSHHSNLMDCIDENCQSPFCNRLNKETYALQMQYTLSDSAVAACAAEWNKIFDTMPKSGKAFFCGLLARLFHSCLVDADRTDAGCFGYQADIPTPRLEYEWHKLAAALELYMTKFTDNDELNSARAYISDCCKNAATTEVGIKRLSVPTGGGKTLASMRFAISHCEHNKLDRIIYVLPYITIIEQNADVIRKMFAEAGIEDIVLEHHSNLITDETVQSKDGDDSIQGIAAENFDKQIIFTTSVQFLDSFFGYGGSTSRRMHNFSNACIIFDEVQTIPFKCINLFNMSIRFLTEVCHSTVVLCTATQPALDNVPSEKYRLLLPKNADIIGEDLTRRPCFARVTPLDMTQQKMSIADQAKLVGHELENADNCMVITNTKRSALELYTELSSRLTDTQPYYLSTDLCPAHRKERIAEIKRKLLDGERIAVVSTSLIEAGVDISFNVVIRYLTGLDSIIQAAGRCNRNGELIGKSGRLIIIEPETENIERMDFIVRGKETSRRVLNELRSQQHDNLFSDTTINRYFYYSYNEKADRNKHDMSYALANGKTLCDLLSTNGSRRDEFLRQHKSDNAIVLPQSFSEANRLFSPIDADTFGIICPFGDGKDLITKIRTADEYELKALLRKAQMYSINRYINEKNNLISNGIIARIHEIYEIYSLPSYYYSDEYGFTKSMDNCIL